jgi:hypothetical protein
MHFLNMPVGKQNKSRKPMTAVELINELNHDPEFVRRRQEQDNRLRAHKQHFEDAERPLVRALNDVAGVSVKSVWDLVNTRREYRRAIPILVVHLGYEYPHRIREGIARALTVKYAGEDAYAALVREFRKSPNGADAAEFGLKWALGNAVSVVADRSHFDEVVELARDKRHGASRDMMVLRLPGLDPLRAVDVLIELLSDDEVAGFAVKAIRKLKGLKAHGQIERLLEHPDARVRREARKALDVLNG